MCESELVRVDGELETATTKIPDSHKHNYNYVYKTYIIKIYHILHIYL